MDLRGRATFLGSPFSEIYDVHYAELSRYAHPGVGTIAGFEPNVYPAVCAAGYEVGSRCYIQTLRFVIMELRLAVIDLSIERKLDFARMVAFTDNPEQAGRSSS